MIITRLGGVNRIATALEIADEFRGDSRLNAVILASANNFPDALAGISLCSKYNAPILLVNLSNPNVQKYYIANNKKKNLYVLGSTGVFSKGLLSYITQ